MVAGNSKGPIVFDMRNIVYRPYRMLLTSTVVMDGGRKKKDKMELALLR